MYYKQCAFVLFSPFNTIFFAHFNAHVLQAFSRKNCVKKVYFMRGDCSAKNTCIFQWNFHLELVGAFCFFLYFLWSPFFNFVKMGCFSPNSMVWKTRCRIMVTFCLIWKNFVLCSLFWLEKLYYGYYVHCTIVIYSIL